MPHSFMQLRDVAREDAYNYELQYQRMFDEEITIRHGDIVSGACMFNSMDRTEVTPGGLASQEEMCLNFILNYPASCGAPHATFNALHPASPIACFFPFVPNGKLLQVTSGIARN
jgi:Copper type II ascorbate-dependent monooxygenase, C-terminal domain